MIGHGKILETLKKEAHAGRLHHAQLFVGPEHVGKTAAALRLAVFLQGGEENVIVKKQVLEGLSPDTVLFLDTGESLSIEEIRKVIERSGESHMSPYLIVVIENVGRMKPEAMNALLKTLEEPLPETLFLLTANNEEDVLPTIRSRCQVTRFQTVPDREMRAGCEGHVQTDRLLFFAMGRPGKLKRLIENSEYLAAHEQMLQDLISFTEKASTPGVFALVRKYEADPYLPELLDILLCRLRHWALGAECPQALRSTPLTPLLERVEESKLGLKNNVNAKLLLETLFLTFVP
jgi:DNA polymerase-3 subunit delta'